MRMLKPEQVNYSRRVITLSKLTAAIILFMGIAFNYAVYADLSQQWMYLAFGLPMEAVWLYLLWCVVNMGYG